MGRPRERESGVLERPLRAELQEESDASAPDRAARLLDAVRGHGIFALDGDGRIVSWNAGAERLTGYMASEVLGQPLSMLGTERSGVAAGLGLQLAREAGSFQQERWWRRRDGVLVWVHEFLNPTDEGGYVVVARDLSEEVEAEDRHRAGRAREEEGHSRETALHSQLQAAERRAAFLVEASSVLVATSLDFESTLRALSRLAVSRIAEWCVVHSLNQDGNLVRAEIAHRDPSVERRLGTVMGRTLRGDWERTLRSVIRTAQPQILEGVPADEWLAGTGTNGMALPDAGSGATASVMITPLMGRGRVLGAITFFGATDGRDYDEDDLALADELGRRAAIALDNARLYREAQEANRAKADFLAVISHELRTPLNAIMGYSDLLDAGISGDLTDRQRRQTDRIRASARHLLQLIEEILGFARLEAGSEEVRPELVNAAELADEAAAVIEPIASSKQLEFRVEADPDVVVETDPGKTRQILVNLLSNAVKFTERGTVTLRVRHDGEHVIFDVVDTGIGIPSDQMSRIFDPFWQAERPNTRRVGGTGLGLSVSRRYVRLLRGEFEIESEPGRGTRVSVLLPHRLTGRPAAPPG
jgi:PAS domain S-box-containing protein